MAASDHIGAQFSRMHYEDLAQHISQQPNREELAGHFASHLLGTNPNFDSGRFKNAASTEGYSAKGGKSPKYSRGQLEHLASGVKNAPGDTSALAHSMGKHLASTNPNFKQSRWDRATS